MLYALRKMHVMFFLICIAALCCSDVYAALRGNVQSHEVSERSYSTIPGYYCFRDIDGMTDAMFDLEKQYPELVSIQTIGKSYLNVDIHAMKITSSESEAAFKGVALFTGGVHAREYAPPELLMRFAESMLENYDHDADTTWILDHTEIHIVFYVNPDGRKKAEQQSSASWRKNVNPGTNNNCSSKNVGVDINRNFDFLWGDTSGASKNPCADDYMGPYASSESETIALTEYAKSLFPVDQRKIDPIAQMNNAFGEDITGLYMDIHAYGGFTYYPWGHKDAISPDNSSLEALGRKISSFNGYDLWAGGQPDFQYPVSGDTSDYMYAVLGVASLGLEIGTKFHESCSAFENSILPSNLPALLYATKVSSKPNALVKGPDVTQFSVVEVDNALVVTASASDSQLVNIAGYPTFETGDQGVSDILLYLDVHPDNFDGEIVEMTENGGEFETTVSTSGLSSGRHILYAQARDHDGYLGPVSSIFVSIDSSGPSTGPTATPTQTNQWAELLNEDFSSDYGAFGTRGRGIRHYVNAKKKKGVVRIKNGELHKRVDSSFTRIKVTFSALWKANTDTLCLETKQTNSTWEKVRCWTGDEFNPTWQDDVSAEFNTDGITPFVVRLRCKGRMQKVFVDYVVISGM